MYTFKAIHRSLSGMLLCENKIQTLPDDIKRERGNQYHQKACEKLRHYLIIHVSEISLLLPLLLQLQVWAHPRVYNKCLLNKTLEELRFQPPKLVDVGNGTVAYQVSVGQNT
ncbi:hypothetical protein G7K_1707-t1 [Saitoella complicata NRRL Y-17804]|uniref:Uncharacterized protein n=1 Tax=Saitoella complicata (strain BCRC 22490 / CBS 7301 / JCM 7358 / NBRC 10748 / NRRL Y-17804) TaxID=698492 RepID=A0A0E9NCS6_SAICN|nr:hypothetical protein G7K_1707-t1 [Saitoella complicata NRRL Y-17804]